MKYDLCSYLRHSLSQAITSAFSLYRFLENDIAIALPHHMDAGDFYSPIAFCLASKLRTDIPSTATRIMERFPWDKCYISPDPSFTRTIVKGFINFFVSDTFVHFIIQCIANYQPKRNFQPIWDCYSPKIVAMENKIGYVMMHFRGIGDADKEMDTNLAAILRRNEEQILIRKIVQTYVWYSHFPKSKKNTVFLLSRIAESFEVFYKKNPIVTPDKQLTMARLYLIRCIYHLLLMMHPENDGWLQK